jgi:hypothetical protein
LEAMLRGDVLLRDALLLVRGARLSGPGADCFGRRRGKPGALFR